LSTNDVTAMQGSRIVVGVAGGIAAYKVAGLVSRLVQAGATVDVVMTEAAMRFVAPLTFQALTHRPVLFDTFEFGSSGQIPHVELAEAANMCVVAPATADIIAKLAHGFADNLLTTMLLGFQGRLLLAPAMDVGMYEHASTKANVALLRERGAQFIGPVLGRLASGREGLGRMSEPDDIFGAIKAMLQDGGKLDGLSIVVTAGGTQEPIDPVRYIGNRSSGKMGYALASVAAQRGASVALITAPTSLEPPAGVTTIRVGTTEEMRKAVLDAARQSDVVIMAAAVADYRAARPAEQKLKRTGDNVTIELVENPDISAEVGAISGGPLLVTFAAETADLVEHAKAKLVRKGAAMSIANDVTLAGSGFGSDDNLAVLLYRDREPEHLPLMSKVRLAGIVLDRVADMLRKPSTAI
jgi:phosphopantothenoylcysteine decarboxylase/phosphopantothenate--cysteine ligase